MRVRPHRAVVGPDYLDKMSISVGFESPWLYDGVYRVSKSSLQQIRSPTIK